MSSDLLFLTCPPRVVKPLVDELTWRLEADCGVARILKYGVLIKGDDGFIIIAIAHPQGLTAKFFEYIRQAEGIIGYVTLTSDNDSGAEMEAHHDSM